MKKIILSIVLSFLSLSVFASSHSLLWKVSGNGLEKPSYILGSHHIAPADFIESIPGLQEAIASADEVYGEIEKDKLTSPAAQQMMMVLAMAPADSTLTAVLSPEDFALVDKVFTSYTNMPGMLSQMVMLKPAIVETQLSVLQSSKAFPGFDPTNAFDVAVMSAGENLGKPVKGLETLDQQMSLIFGTPISVQAEALVKAAKNDAELIEFAKKLADAYLAQDIDSLYALMHDPVVGTSERDWERLIDNRNRDWASKLPALMSEKPLFVVVGCGHLPGENGLLNLLRQKGYTVEPVSK